MAELPPTLFHGTSLAAALDILGSNRMDVSPVGRDKGPRGVSLTRSAEVADRFATIKMQDTPLWRLDSPLPGIIMEFSTTKLFATGHRVVHYKGAYSSREKEERLLGPIENVRECLAGLRIASSVGLRSDNVDVAELERRIQAFIEGDNNFRNRPLVITDKGRQPAPESEGWKPRLAVLKRHRRWF